MWNVVTSKSSSRFLSILCNVWHLVIDTDSCHALAQPANLSKFFCNLVLSVTVSLNRRMQFQVCACWGGPVVKFIASLSKVRESAQVQSWAGHVSSPSWWLSAALCGRANEKQPYRCGNVTRAYDTVFKTVHMAGVAIDSRTLLC